VHDVRRGSRSERGLAPSTAEGSCEIGAFTLLQQHDQYEEDADEDIQNHE
jgi:hypothetical protein